MISRTTARFRKVFAKLPKQIRRQAREAYKLFQQNPYHPVYILSKFIRCIRFILQE